MSTRTHVLRRSRTRLIGRALGTLLVVAVNQEGISKFWSLRKAPLVAIAVLALGAGATSVGVAAADERSPDGLGLDAVRCDRDLAPGTATRASAFDAASRAAKVPRDLLLAVSYMQSRWDQHGADRSTSGGYGPMHLTDIRAGLDPQAKGDGTERNTESALRTLDRASKLTELPDATLKSDAGANVCGGAAVLASYQHAAGGKLGASTDPSSWRQAVARYAPGGRDGSAERFVRDVYTMLKQGASRTTNDGQKVVLQAHPNQQVPVMSSRPSGQDPVDCPKSLGCEWIPAPYEQLDAQDPTSYGNHDLANRPKDLDIEYLVIHDTEATYDTTLKLVQDPAYVSWNYTLRSSDGHIAQHVDNKNVAFHAGNWYVNTHSIGLEHEGFAAQGGAWYTESMYRTSAELVRHLTKKYDIPRDRAHIIGHDQVPGTTTATIPGMHWDPGPFWDWEHYMDLVRAPIGMPKVKPINVGDTVTIKPGFAQNAQEVRGCDTAGVACPRQGTNFVYLRTSPDAASPLVSDKGLFPDGRAGSTNVSDISARAAAGQQLVVSEVRGDWLRVSWLGADAWLRNARTAPAVVKGKARSVTLEKGLATAPTFGRAFPEASAYLDGIEPQTQSPFPYTLKPGQRYALADGDVPTDYYFSKTFGGKDAEVVRGKERYVQIWFGHRFAYVKKADVVIG